MVRKLVNAKAGLTFPSMQMFFAALFCLLIKTQNTEEAKQYTENLTAKLQNSNQNSTFPGLA